MVYSTNYTSCVMFIFLETRRWKTSHTQTRTYFDLTLKSSNMFEIDPYLVIQGIILWKGS